MKFSSRLPTQLGNVRIDNLTQIETLDAIEQMIESRQHHRMVVVNASKLILAENNPELLNILKTSDLVTADGMSVVWASGLSKSFGEKLVERVTGIDTLIGLAARAAISQYRIFLLGAEKEILEQTVQVLENKFPGIKIIGYRDGYFSNNESAKIAKEIKNKHTDILFIAMGSPKQEEWLAEFGPQTGVSFCLGVGGSFDHIAGKSKRAPLWMQKIGMEWLYRLSSEPKRLWKRYLIGNTKFILHIITLRLKN